MNVVRFKLTICLFTILALGCSAASTATDTGKEPMPSEAQLPDPLETFDLPNARSISLTGNDTGTLYLAYGVDHSLYVSHSTDGGRTFSDGVLATADSQAHVLPVERPAITANADNRVGVAWLELPPDFQGAKIWYAISEDAGETFAHPVLAATESAGEVAMVQTAMDDDGNVYLAWLNGSQMNFSKSLDGGATFSEAVHIGGGSCECCQLHMIVDDEILFIAYRGLETGDPQGDIRDILLLRSVDGGETFAPITRVSDTHWYLPACPIAGQSMSLHQGSLLIAFMDGRFEPAGTFSRGDAWFAVSDDLGATFSQNVRINPDQDSHHTLPSIAVGPGGRIHVAWESLSQGEEKDNLYYTTSDDGGQTFASPQVIADNSDQALGSPGKPVLFIDSAGNLTLAWLDRSGAHMSSWVDTR